MKHPGDSLDDDIRDHIERETADNIERGMTPEAARTEALRRFGNITRIKEETRQVWTWIWLEQLTQDIHYGFRMLRKNPGLSIVTVLTLALGIGINTAVWSVINSVLLKPLAYPNSDRLVWLSDYDPFFKRDVVNIADTFAWREHASSFTAMAPYGYNQAPLVTAQDASSISGVAIGGDFWAITGAQPALGRLFQPEEQDAIVLSWELFQRQFAGDPHIVGSSVLWEGRPVTVTGVLAPDFRFQFPTWWTPARGQAAEAFVPFARKGDLQNLMGSAVALLKPGVTTQQALAELEVMERHMIEQQRGPYRHSLFTKLRVDTLQEKLIGNVRPALLILFAAGAFVLLIATVNIANLLLARSTGRQREIAIRAAVGAGRMRVVRQLLAESTIPALAGGVMGLLLAHWGIAILIVLLPNALPRLAETGIDPSVLAFTLAISLGAGILCGTGPALSAWRTSLYEALKDGARSSSSTSKVRVRRFLVAGELALAMVLLTGAGLMLKSFVRMNTRPPGFVPEKILLVSIRLSGSQYDKLPAQQSYLREVLQRLESAPGVQAVGSSTRYGFAGAPAFPADSQPNQTHSIRINSVSEKYAQALGIQLIKGRWLTDHDSAGTAVLNESMAREAFGAADPIGHQLSIPERVTVVGIVADLKYSKLDAAPPSEVFIPYSQSPFLKSVDIAIRTDRDSSVVTQEVRKVIATVDPAQPVYAMRTLEQELAGSIAPRRFNFFLLGTFAGAAVFLALIGIYGVSGYLIAERTKEIGVRVALGAQSSQVVRMVVIDGMTTALAGILGGVAAAWGMTRLMSSLLYDVKANDPLTFTAVTLALVGAGLLACWIPALKAASIDPVIALRHE